MRLVEKLNDMNLSIYKLSFESGVAKSTLNDIFIGKSSLYDCNGKTLLSIARVLNISIEELLSLKQEDYKIEYEKNFDCFFFRIFYVDRGIYGGGFCGMHRKPNRCSGWWNKLPKV